MLQLKGAKNQLLLGLLTNLRSVASLGGVP